MEGDKLGHDVFLEGIFEDVFKEVRKDFTGNVLIQINRSNY